MLQGNLVMLLLKHEVWGEQNFAKGSVGPLNGWKVDQEASSLTKFKLCICKQHFLQCGASMLTTKKIVQKTAGLLDGEAGCTKSTSVGSSSSSKGHIDNTIFTLPLLKQVSCQFCNDRPTVLYNRVLQMKAKYRLISIGITCKLTSSGWRLKNRM